MDDYPVQRERSRILLWTALALVVGLLAGWLVLRLTWLADLPSLDELPARMARPATRIYDRNGRLLYEVLDPNAGKLIELPAVSPEENRYGVAGVPDACVQATLATEDQRFFLHPGVDPLAIARAAWQNFRAGGQIVSGASTLTQQLARTLLMEPEERYDRSLRRKVREAYLALQLEWRYSKAELLRLYLNQTYYGNFAVGLEAAAQNFFAKPAAQLSRAECALLAGLVQYPPGYNPLRYPEAAKERQRTVLRLMVDAGFITQEEAAQIAAEPLRYRSRLFEIRAPHFVMYVQDLLVEQLGVDRLRAGGLEVYTTLDLGLQRQVEAAVRHRLEQLNCRAEESAAGGEPLSPLCQDPAARSRRIDNAAAVVLDAATGDILAMVGSPDYFDDSIQGNVNAALSLRQPGSAIKPLTYAAAMDPAWSQRLGLEPLTPASILPDLPRAFPGLRNSELAALQPGALGESGA
ncbi:MAG: penicillin-binding protein, partial [Caldilineae bacterium]